MNKTKLIIIISLILVFSGAFIALDFLQIFQLNDFNQNFSLVLKGGIVFLTSLLVFTIHNHGISKMDTKLLQRTFILIIIADLSLLIFKKPYMGILLFFFVQCVLIYRNSRYIYHRYSFKKLFDRYSIFLASILSALLLIYLILIGNSITDSYLLLCFIFYGIIKSVSLLTAIICYRFKALSKTNNLILLIGVICFYFCDLNVGLTMTLNGSYIKDVSTILIWIFYTPALTLIALSGYDLNNL